MFALILGLSALAGLVFGCCALFGLRERTWGSALLVTLGSAAATAAIAAERTAARRGMICCAVLREPRAC